jgi:transcription initiation factor TFIIIB Brf1 subunit/transcription initiation factor TFIIB
MDIEKSWELFESLRKIEEKTTSKSENVHFFCGACGGQKTFGMGIDLPTCIECGLVDEEYMSEEPEWRSGGDDGGPDPSRVGAPSNLDHFSAAWNQGTIMNVKNSACYAQKRLARINFHTSMNHRDRALFHAYAEMDRIGKTILNLQDNVMYSAKIKYRAFNEAVLTRGAVRNGIKANCIFQACREFNVPRSTREIADAFGIPSRDISRTFEMYQEQVPETEVHVTTPADLVPRFFNAVNGIPEDQKGRVKMKVVSTCKQLEDCVELMGRTPKAVACTVMFIVLTKSGFPQDKSELCKICDVSAPTLGKIEAIIKANLRI